MSHDQYETDDSFFGSYTDDTIIAAVSQNLNSINRTFIISKQEGNYLNNFKSLRLPYSQKIGYISGSFSGKNSKNFNITISSETEGFLDSYLPSPLEISLKNGKNFPRIDSVTEGGEFQKSEIFPNKTYVPNSINLFLSEESADKYSNLKFDADSFLDTEWLKNPYPFSTPYKNLKRIFKTTTNLSKEFTLDKDKSGEVTGSVSTNQLGSIYYLTPNEVTINFSTVMGTYWGPWFEYNPSGLPDGSKIFSPMRIFFPSCRTLRSIEGTRAKDNDNNNLIYFTGGDSGVFGISKDGLNWEVITTSSSLGSITGSNSAWGTNNNVIYCKDITHSVLANPPDYSFGRWGIVGENETGDPVIIIQSNGSKIPTRNNWHYFDKTTLDSQTGLSIGKLHAMEYSDKYGIGDSNMWVAVGEDTSGEGIIIYNNSENPTNLVESWQAATFSGIVPSYPINRVVFFNNTSSAPGDQGNFFAGSKNLILKSQNGDETTWDTIFSQSNLSLDAFGAISVLNDGQQNRIFAHTTNGNYGIQIYSEDRGASWIEGFEDDTVYIRVENTAEVSSSQTDLSFVGAGHSDYIKMGKVFPSGKTYWGQQFSDSAGSLYNTFNTDLLDVVGSVFTPNGTHVLNYEKDVQGPIWVGESFRDLANPERSNLERNPVCFRLADLQTNVFYDEATNQFFDDIHVMNQVGFFATRGNPFVSSSGGSDSFGGMKKIRPSFSDIIKCFYGLGNGITAKIKDIVVSGSNDNNIEATTSRFFRKKSPSFKGLGYVNDLLPNSEGFELARLYGPSIRQWRYGILNGTPLKTSAIFRRGKFGQFRDMLEQRHYSAFLDTKDGKFSISYPLQINFIEGSSADTIYKEYRDATDTVSSNPEDSGIYDQNYRSGKPFNDLDGR